VKYKVVVESDAGKLTEAVNTKIAAGWKPVGGIAVAVFGDQVGMIQAMVKQQKAEAESSD